MAGIFILLKSGPTIIPTIAISAREPMPTKAAEELIETIDANVRGVIKTQENLIFIADRKNLN